MPAEEGSHFSLLHPPLRNRQDEVHECVFARCDFYAVEQQEHQRGRRAHPPVTVYERVVHHDVKQVGGSHLWEVAVQVLSAHSRLGRGDGRSEQAHVADPRAAAVSLYLVAVDFDDLLKREKQGFQRLLRQPLQRPRVSRVDLLEGLLEPPPLA